MKQSDPLLTGSPGLATFHADSLMLTRLAELACGVLIVTDKVRARFPDNSEDLHARAARPVHQSAEVGLMEKRAYVEIDATVGMVCLDNGLEVKFKWKGVCDIQIVGGWGHCGHTFLKFLPKNRCIRQPETRQGIISSCSRLPLLAMGCQLSGLYSGSNHPRRVHKRTSRTRAIHFKTVISEQNFTSITTLTPMQSQWCGKHFVR